MSMAQLVEAIKNSNLGDVVKSTSSIFKTALEGCGACNRDGDIAILPVRYSAACKEADSDVFLPQQEIARFTDIIPAQDSPVRYIYRKLCKDFLYVYDDHP